MPRGTRREPGARPHRDTPAPAVTTTRPPRPLIVAHRGAAAVAPEHTIPAYESAVAAGADALWLDVQETADEQLVVVHDVRLERTTNGRGPVRERTVRELKRLDAGRWFGWRFRGQRIQTLPEVLERFRGRAGFVVALRAGSDVYPGIEERALGLLHLYGAADRTLVASYDHHALLALPRPRLGDPPRSARRGPAPRAGGPRAARDPHHPLPRRGDGPRARRGRLPRSRAGVLLDRGRGGRRRTPSRRLAAHRPGHGVRLRLLSTRVDLDSRHPFGMSKVGV